MLDIKFLRENPDVVKQNIKNKFQEHKLPLVDEVIALDKERRETQQKADDLRALRKKNSKMILILLINLKQNSCKNIDKLIYFNISVYFVIE